MIADDPTIPPREVVDSFRSAYVSVNNCDPQIFYRGNHWYMVNGEAVHRVMVLRETWRLRGMAQRQSLKNTDKSILSRLINKLRGL